MTGPRPVLSLALLALLALQSCSYELHDTIHALMEENIHLHDQLENLTQALRELGRMIWHHSNDPDQHHDEDAQHLWSEHGISAETHLLLEHALCGHDPHSSAAPRQEDTFVLLLTLAGLDLLQLLACS